jgi:hypothetical protein
MSAAHVLVGVMPASPPLSTPTIVLVGLSSARTIETTDMMIMTDFDSIRKSS